MHKILLNLQNVTFYNKTLTRLHRHKTTAFARCFGAVSILTSGLSACVSRSVAVVMLASNMVNTFAVCMTAKAGSTAKFSKVTSLSLDRDFDTVFNEHNVDDKLTLVEYEQVFVRLALTCGTPMEFPYYSSKVGIPDICAFCGDSGGSRPQELCAQYKVVLPICKKCEEKPIRRMRGAGRGQQATAVPGAARAAADEGRAEDREGAEDIDVAEDNVV